MSAMGEIAPLARIGAAEKLLGQAKSALGAASTANNRSIDTATQLVSDATYELRKVPLDSAGVGFTGSEGLSPRAQMLVSSATSEVISGRMLLDLERAGVRQITNLPMPGGASSAKAAVEAIAAKAAAGPSAGKAAPRVTTASPDDMGTLRAVVESDGSNVPAARNRLDAGVRLLKQAHRAQEQASGAEQRSLALHKSLGNIDADASLEKSRVPIEPWRSDPRPLLSR